MIIRILLALIIIGTSAVLVGRTSLADGSVAQPIILPLEELVLETRSGEFRFHIEIADEVHERSMGLMFRDKMAPNRGMLFDFNETEPVAMWMQNTPLSLDMIFIRPDGEIERIERNTKPFSTRVISSGAPVSHVLEINAGVGLLIGLQPGDRVRHRFFSSEN